MTTPNTSLSNLFVQRAAVDAAKASTEAVRIAMIEKARQASSLAAFKNNENIFNEMIAAEHARWRIWKLDGFEKLLGEEVGSGQCPAIVQSYGGLPKVRFWSEGPKVRGNPHIPYGTAIATFIDGKYPNMKHGNHAAIYLEQDPSRGVHVFEQFSGVGAQKRWLPYKDGRSDRSNDGAAFSVILTRN